MKIISAVLLLLGFLPLIGGFMLVSDAFGPLMRNQYDPVQVTAHAAVAGALFLLTMAIWLIGWLLFSLSSHKEGALGASP